MLKSALPAGIPAELGTTQNAFLKSNSPYISTHLRSSTQMEVFKMGKRRFTVSISKELKERLDEQPDVNWAEVAKQGIIKKAKQLEKFERLEREGVI